MLQYPKKLYICLDCRHTFPIDMKLRNLIGTILGKKKNYMSSSPL